MREIDRQAFREVAWVGKAALFCLGLLAMLALVVVIAVLTPVLLTSTILPATVVGHRRDLRRRCGRRLRRVAPYKCQIVSERAGREP